MHGSLRVMVASGKGGTGKTTVATSLADVLSRAGLPTAYLDCDVEEPNGHLLLRPAIRDVQQVSVPVPEVDRSRCTLCGACAAACRFSAISVLPRTVLTFPELCHGCGACALACPCGAIREVPRVTGVVETGTAGELLFVGGRLEVGEAMAPPVVRAVLASSRSERPRARRGAGAGSGGAAWRRHQPRRARWNRGGRVLRPGAHPVAALDPERSPKA